MSISSNAEARVGVSSNESGSHLLAVVVDVCESFNTSLRSENPLDRVSLAGEMTIRITTVDGTMVYEIYILAVISAELLGFCCDIL